jgi:FMNH2-dependent dimethyl sulfone monooxygenase
MTETRISNPMFGDQPLKLGVFAYLHEGSNYLSKHPDRWRANWPDIEAIARMADRARLDFMMPLSSWKGWSGEVDQRKKSFETLTHAAALAAVTDHIGIFATVHVPLIHPVFAAKSMTTIDHISGGRSGLIIVCGWNPADSAMFGVPHRAHDDRYDHGFEWYEIMTRILHSGTSEFDYDGQYFPGLKAISGEPLAIQQPRPAIISATFSEAGRRFAAKTSDFILMPGRAAGLNAGIADVRAREREVGRPGEPLRLIATARITCRETRAEAEDAQEDYCVRSADALAVDQWVSVRADNAQSSQTDLAKARLAAAGGGGIVGTPQDVADALIELHRIGFCGVAMSMFNYLNDLPIILEQVLPILERAGVRYPADRLTAAA